jgi:hypothetical protein
MIKSFKRAGFVDLNNRYVTCDVRTGVCVSSACGAQHPWTLGMFEDAVKKNDTWSEMTAGHELTRVEVMSYARREAAEQKSRDNFKEYVQLREALGYHKDDGITLEVWSGCEPESQENMLDQFRQTAKYALDRAAAYGDAW